MALARLDVPAVMLYGGSIPPGRFQGHDVTIQDVFEAVGAHASGAMTDEELAELESVASPGAGACGGQFTANTMAMAYEMLGISPIGDSLMPAQEPTKPAVARAAGALVVDVLRRGQRPSSLITREGIENAITAIAASGGSTNGGAAPSRARARGRRRARDRRLRRDQRAHAAALRPQAGRALRGGRPLPRGRRGAARPAARAGRAAARGRADGDRPDDRRDRGRGHARRPGRR